MTNEEINKAIAEKVMGWRRIEVHMDSWDYVHYRYNGKIMKTDFTTNIQAAWQVVEKMESMGYRLILKLLAALKAIA